MTKKIVRLTERDLTRLVRRVIKEQYDDEFELNTRKLDDTKAVVEEHGDTMIFMKGKSSRQVQRALSSISSNIRFIAILNCEYADFSDVDICAFPKLNFVNLKGTPNNFEEVVDCDYQEVMGGYDFNKD